MTLEKLIFLLQELILQDYQCKLRVKYFDSIEIDSNHKVIIHWRQDD